MVNYKLKLGFTDHVRGAENGAERAKSRVERSGAWSEHNNNNK